MYLVEPDNYNSANSTTLKYLRLINQSINQSIYQSIKATNNNYLHKWLVVYKLIKSTKTAKNKMK